MRKSFLPIAFLCGLAGALATAVTAAVDKCVALFTAAKELAVGVLFVKPDYEIVGAAVMTQSTAQAKSPAVGGGSGESVARVFVAMLRGRGHNNAAV